MNPWLIILQYPVLLQLLKFKDPVEPRQNNSISHFKMGFYENPVRLSHDFENDEIKRMKLKSPKELFINPKKRTDPKKIHCPSSWEGYPRALVSQTWSKVSYFAVFNPFN